jgi:hypothetical protein
MRRLYDTSNRWAGCALLAAVLLATAALPAGAQIVYDANIMYNNGNLTYPAGQYTGSCKACIADPTPCPDSTALIIGTTRYTHNVYLDPLLPFASTAGGAVNITHPSFQPQAGSPAYVGNDPTVVLVDPNPGDAFFDRVCFVGAVGPKPEDDWTQGWTYWDSLGAGRQDLHLPGMPGPRPLAIYVNTKLYSDQTWSPDSNYLVAGFLRVKDQATLTVQAGTVIFGSTTPGQQGAIIAERGGKLRFLGTREAPIICTSDAPPGQQVRGGWGGIWMLGRAVCNCANTAAGDSCASEGGSIGFFGGTDDHDNSGEYHYVRVEYSGYPISIDNELNSFTFDGVGDGTQVDHCQAHRGDDDGFEWFGGTGPQPKYCITSDGNDDGFDWQMGTRTKGQFLIVRELGDGLQTDKGIEADNNEFNFDTPNGPRSNTMFSNCTFVGDRRSGFPGPQTSGVNFRRGTFGTFVNSIVYNYPKPALKVDDAATYRAACGQYPTPTVWCDAATVGVAPEPATVATGTLFVSHYPNPFRSQMDVQFVLPTAAHVRVDLFSADGRKVGRLADEDMAAGPHSLRWNPEGSVASGVYFYRVRAGNLVAEGRVIRVD